MNYNKILSKIQKLEEKSLLLLTELKSHNILKTENDLYLKSDKDSFKLLWEKYIVLFLELQSLIKKTSYRKYIFFTDYNKLVLNKYLLFIYFNSLLLIIKYSENIKIF